MWGKFFVYCSLQSIKVYQPHNIEYKIMPAIKWMNDYAVYDFHDL